MTEAEREIFHRSFEKVIGEVRVLSRGGGAPRFVIIESPPTMSMEQARDLHYALGRLLEDLK